MAKKKNSSRKHKFKHVDPTAVAQADSSSVVAAGSPGVLRTALQQPKMAGGRDFSYVTHDIRRIAVMAGALVALELLFYYLLLYTSVGPAVYGLVKV